MEDDIFKYFPKSYTKSDIQKTIISLLEKWQRQKRKKQEGRKMTKRYITNYSNENKKYYLDGVTYKSNPILKNRT